jgi:hypothetical protein
MARGDGAGGFIDAVPLPALSNDYVDAEVADLDGDGICEGLIADESPAQVFVVHVDGGGQLVVGATLPLPAEPWALTTGDADNDGDVDVLVVLAGGGGLLLARNTGAGAFLPVTPIAGTAGASGAALGDLDGDGQADLALARDDDLATLPGTGGGSFGAALALTVACDTVVLADLNVDGVLDAVCTFSKLNVVRTLLGDGNGSLLPAATLGLAGYTYLSDLQVADLSQDGRPDVVVHGNFELLVSLGDGAGGLLPAKVLDVGYSYSSALGDVDGDLRPDVVSAGGGAVALTVLRAVGEGQFEVPRVSKLANGWYEEVQGIDIDGDGDADAFVAEPFERVAAYMNSGSGTFAKGKVFASFSTKDFAGGDLDGDGDADLVITFTSGTTAQVWTNAGGGVFTGPVTHTVGSSANRPSLVDVNGDDALDLVLLTGGPAGGLAVALGTGAGGFQTTMVVATPGSGGTFGALVLGDVTGDGHVDAVLGGSVFNPWSGVIRVLAGDGLGGFAQSAQSTGGQPLTDLALADLDRDGDLDVGASQFLSEPPTTYPLVLFTNDGSGQFAPGAELPFHADGLASGDIDGDGFADLLAAGIHTGNIALLRGTASGELAITTHEVGYIANDVSVGDVDEDGRLDVLAVNQNDVLNARLSVLGNLSTDSPWKDLGAGLLGVSGWPELKGQGSLLPASPAAIRLTDGAPSAPALLFVSLGSAPLPFKGGVLKATPILLSLPLLTDADGDVYLPFTWPTGVPAGTPLVLQTAVQDSEAVAGVALSNALQGTTP